VELYKTQRSKGLEIVSVNVRNSAEEVAAFAREFGATFHVAPNRTPTDVARLYRLEATPTNVLIDREGNVAARLVGFDMARLERALIRLGIH